MFLYGTMTSQELGETGTDSTLLKLLCGEIADSLGNKVPPEHAWERDSVDPTVLNCNGFSIGSPTNRNGIAFRIKWVGSISTDGRICEMQLSFRNRNTLGGCYGNFVNWTSDGGRILIAYPGTNTEQGPLTLNYFIDVTKDRTIIATQGILPPGSGETWKAHDCLLYVGTFHAFMSPSIDLHPVVIASTHCTPQEIYYQSHGYERGFHMYMGCNGEPDANPITDKARYWLTHGRGNSVKLCMYGDDYYQDMRPRIGKYTSGTVSAQDPDLWSGKWFLYPLFVASSKVLYRGESDPYPIEVASWRGYLLDVFGHERGVNYATQTFHSWDVTVDGQEKYRHLIPTTTTYSDAVNIPPQFARSFVASLAFRQSS